MNLISVAGTCDKCACTFFVLNRRSRFRPLGSSLAAHRSFRSHYLCYLRQPAFRLPVCLRNMPKTKKNASILKWLLLPVSISAFFFPHSLILPSFPSHSQCLFVGLPCETHSLSEFRVVTRNIRAFSCFYSMHYVILFRFDSICFLSFWDRCFFFHLCSFDIIYLVEWKNKPKTMCTY